MGTFRVYRNKKFFFENWISNKAPDIENRMLKNAKSRNTNIPLVNI